MYKYDADSNDVYLHLGPTMLTLLTLLVIFLYALLLCVYIRPAWFGVCLTCFCEAIGVGVVLLLNNTNNRNFRKVKKYIDPIIIRQAWLDSKQNFCDQLNLTCRKELVNYE